MKILVFGFRNNIAEEIVKNFDIKCVKVLIDSDLKSIDAFMSSLNGKKYDCIVGIGKYSGRDQDKIRIESIFTNQFRKTINKNNLMDIKTIPFLKDISGFKYAYKAGNSWCNLVSYKLVKLRPSVKYSFLHIPNNYSLELATKLIQNNILDQTSIY
jgi:pyrrolidone-carboxylate peptidase